MAKNSPKYRGILVSETHWDREWYLSFQEFRKWLVKLIDDLLDNLPKHPEFKSFMLDGQTIVLEDYLEIRPERKADLQKFIQQQRIYIGPFYVLADEFLESGEGMIRNLLLGHKISEQYGVKPMKVGYVPDTFGHIWQLPQILDGFGIHSMYYFRGYPPVFGNHEEIKGKNDTTPLEHYYMSPDGTKALTLHHITGYGNAANICEGKRPEFDEFPYMNAVMRIGESLSRISPRIKSNLILLMNGSDHLQAEWDLPDMIERWNTNEDIQEEIPIRLEHGTLEDYFREVREQTDKLGGLPTITGEARGSMYTQVTPGCISTRMNLKIFNWKVTRELEKYAEPFAAFAWTLGGDYQGAFIEHAWKWLIQNHPHDSICGCSLDRVHEDMITRFNWAMDNATDVANYACAAILSGIDLEGLIQKTQQKYGEKANLINIQVLGAFNPNSFKGPFIIEDYIALMPRKIYTLYDYQGNQIEEFHIEYIPDYRTNVKEGQYLYKRFQSNWALGKLTALLNDVPPCGYKIYYLLATEEKAANNLRKEWMPAPITTDHYEIQFNTNGSMNLRDLATNITYHGLNIFEDGADDGDEYDWAPLPNDIAHTTKDETAEFTLLSENSIFTEISAKIGFQVPYELLGDADSVRLRSKESVVLHLETIYRIYLHFPRVEIKTRVINKAKGHRLRALFPAGFTVEHSYADDHFMVLKRTVTLPKDDGWFQDMQGIYHQDTFVDVNNGQFGMALLNKGLCEFEVIPTPPSLQQEGHAIALTLFRSVAWLSQKGHLGRKSGLNGPNLQTPGAQLMDQEFEFEYAVVPHKGTWETANIYRAAHAYNSPPRWFSANHRLRNEKLVNQQPFEKGFIHIDNPNVVLSTLKRSDAIDGAKDGLIVRVFNPTDALQKAKIFVGLKPKVIKLVNLLEQDLEDITFKKVDNDSFLEIQIFPYKILTIRLEF